MWPFSKPKPEAAPEPAKSQGVFTTDIDLGPVVKTKVKRHPLLKSIRVPPPQANAEGQAMDADIGAANSIKSGFGDDGVPDAQLEWYASQGFIGYNVCAVIAQHWLVDKACGMPGRDAVRQGYDINIDADVKEPEEIIKALKAFDKRRNINKSMAEFIKMGRVFGIRIAIFKVESTDPEYYQKPFNIDGVLPGSYQGISQVDPIWCIPELTTTAVSQPDDINFYEPEFWRIGNARYHRSHLAIYVPFPVADILKPTYQYAGASVPQRIYERVYASERTANEAPQLAMTKRLTVLKVKAAAFFSNLGEAAENLLIWCGFRDNYGVKVIDKDSEDIQQFDISLADLDTTIMTQYQLVSAIAGVVATKLLGTTPKGFNSTGEYEEAVYREELESIQTNDLTHMLERHHQIAMRSFVAPKLDIAPVATTVSWAPLDSPTAMEWADINLKKAQTAQIYVTIQAIDGIDVRDKLTTDKDSDFFGLAEIVEEDQDAAAQAAALLAPQPEQVDGTEEAQGTPAA